MRSFTWSAWSMHEAPAFLSVLATRTLSARRNASFGQSRMQVSHGFADSGQERVGTHDHPPKEMRLFAKEGR